MSVEGFNYDNIFIKLMNRIGDAMLLSILFVLCSVPVFTIGASLTALHYTAMKGIQIDDGYTWKYFLKSFKENFKQSTVIWLILMLAMFILGVDTWYWTQVNKSNGNIVVNILLIISVVLLCLAVMICMYVFPLQAKFDNKIGVQMRNAFLLSIKYFPTTIFLSFLMAVIALFFYFQPFLSIVGFVMIGFGAFAYLYDYFMLRCFRPYLVPPVDDEAEDYETEDDETEDDETEDDESEADSEEEESGKGNESEADSDEEESGNGIGSEENEEKDENNDESGIEEKTPEEDDKEVHNEDAESAVEEAGDKPEADRNREDEEADKPETTQKKKSIQLTDALEDERERIQAEKKALEDERAAAAKQADEEARKAAEELAGRVKEDVSYDTTGENVFRRAAYDENTNKNTGKVNNKNNRKKQRKR